MLVIFSRFFFLFLSLVYSLSLSHFLLIHHSPVHPLTSYTHSALTHSFSLSISLDSLPKMFEYQVRFFFILIGLKKMKNLIFVIYIKYCLKRIKSHFKYLFVVLLINFCLYKRCCSITQNLLV